MIVWIDQNILFGHLAVITLISIAALAIALLVSTMVRFHGENPSRYIWLLFILVLALAIAHIPGTPAERIHFLEYAALSILWWRVLRHLSPNRQATYLLVLVITASLGVVDELIQYLLPNRWFGLDDILRNASGGALGVMYLGLVEKK